MKFTTQQLACIHLLADNPGMTNIEISKRIGVSDRSIYIWKKNQDFSEEVYKRFRKSVGAELPSILQALVKEAKAGNVQAAKLILEHSGKLTKKSTIKIDSPFEKFLRLESANTN